MSPRLRKFIGMLAILAFLVAYVGAAAAIGERIPQHWAALLAYYGIVGTFWSLPLIPLVRWMNREG